MKINSNVTNLDQQEEDTRCSFFNPPKGEITTGQGEYIVYYGDSNEVSRDTFEKVYRIFDYYSPTNIVDRGDKVPKDLYHILRTAVRKLDPDLKFAFIPKTLYELSLIQQCLEEDIKKGSICPNSIYESPKKDARVDCWHLQGISSSGRKQPLPQLIDIAYKLNQIMVQDFTPKKELGFNHDELIAFTNKKIEYLKDFQETYSSRLASNDKGLGWNLSKLFGKVNVLNCSSRKGFILDDVILNAVTLECSRIAQKSFILYRGGDYILPVKGKSYSASYGTGLFAGCLHDKGATAYCCLERNNGKGFFLEIPFDQLQTSPFFKPVFNTIEQLYGQGEFFHARSKITMEDLRAYRNDGSPIEGIFGTIFNGQLGHLGTYLSKERLIEMMRDYSEQNRVAILPNLPPHH